MYHAETDFHSKALRFQAEAVYCVEAAVTSLLENFDSENDERSWP